MIGLLVICPLIFLAVKGGSKGNISSLFSCSTDRTEPRDGVTFPGLEVLKPAWLGSLIPVGEIGDRFLCCVTTPGGDRFKSPSLTFNDSLIFGFRCCSCCCGGGGCSWGDSTLSRSNSEIRLWKYTRACMLNA